jgi:hypothetical protein
MDDYLTARYKKIARQFLVILLIAGIFLGGGLLLWDHFVTQKVVTIEGTKAVSISISGRRGTFMNTAKIRVRPGDYTVTYAGSEDYASKTTKIRIDKNTTLQTTVLNYSVKKLQLLLPAELPAVHTAIHLKDLESTYTAAGEQLYVRGEWYAGILKPKDPYTSDYLRVIAKKEGTTWKTVVLPTIVIALKDHPYVPEEIIRDINNRLQ